MVYTAMLVLHLLRFSVKWKDSFLAKNLLGVPVGAF